MSKKDWTNSIKQYWYAHRILYIIGHDKVIPLTYYEDLLFALKNNGTEWLTGTYIASSEWLKALTRYVSIETTPAFKGTYIVNYFKNKLGLDAALCLNKEKRTITLAFRGSESLADWIANFNFKHQVIDVPYHELDHENYAHAGFLHHLKFESQHDNMVRLIYDLSHYFVDEKFNVVITGHSLGGGLATIFTYYLLKMVEHFKIENRAMLACITFNSPPVVSQNVAKYINEHESTISFRYKHMYDWTSSFNLLYRYSHIGDVVYEQDEHGAVNMIPLKDEHQITLYEIVDRAGSLLSYHCLLDLFPIETNRTRDTDDPYDPLAPLIVEYERTKRLFRQST